MAEEPADVRPKRRVARAALAFSVVWAGAVAALWWLVPSGPLQGGHRALVWVGGVALWVLAVLLLLAWRRRSGPLAVTLVLVVWWLGVETFAAPRLVAPLRLIQYFYAQDPDHRPRQTTPPYNEDALRGTPDRDAFTAETCNVVFLGDSFTIGAKVKPGQAFPALVGRRLARRFPEREVRVANFGWSSSSPYLSHRRLVDVGDHYRPDLVVMCVDMTDFHDDILWRNLVEGNGAYALYDRIPIALRLFQAVAPRAYERAVAWTVDAPVGHFFGSAAPLEETREHMDRLGESLAAIEAWCDERGAAFVVVALPRSYQVSERECPDNWEADEYEVLGPYALEPFRWFDELRERVDHPVVSLYEAFRDTDVFPTCFEDDPHWTPAGHRVAAEALAPALAGVLAERFADEGPR